jgi:hypothetical protein
MKTARKSPAGSRRHYRLHGEPTILELLDDPVMEAMMARDGVERAQLVLLIDEVRLRLARRDQAPVLADAGHW